MFTNHHNGVNFNTAIPRMFAGVEMHSLSPFDVNYLFLRKSCLLLFFLLYFS